MPLTGAYNLPLVALSVAIATLASYTALDLAARITAVTGRGRLAWLLGGSTALGIGIWSMHFVGMLAFHLPVPVAYGYGLLLLSMLVAIAASALALFVVSRPVAVGLGALALAALCMGPAIAGMHYLGMAAMNMPAHLSYDAELVAASVAIAIGASFAALWLSHRFRADAPESRQLWKVGSAVLMGVAIAGMHYTGMAAAHFTATAPVSSRAKTPVVALLPEGLLQTTHLAVAVAAATLLILGLGLLGTMTDRWMHNRLRYVERLRRFYEAVSSGIVVQDARGRVVHANRAAADLLGMPHHVPPGATAADLGRGLVNEDGDPVPPDQHPLAVAVRQRAPVRGTVLGLAPGTARERWLLVDAVPIYDPDTGELEEAIASFTDITDRRRAETALRHTTETLAALIKASPLAIFAMDPLGQVTSWNPAAERLFGWRATEVIGHRLPIVPPEHRAVFDEMQAAVLAGQSFLDAEVVRQRRDGSLLTLSLSAAPLYEGTTEVHGIICIAADLTERKRLEDQLRQAQKMEAVGQLAGGLAHDFNNFLTAITGYATFLLSSLEAEDARREDVLEIQRAAERATQLTHQLLAFSRKQMLQPTVLDLNAILADTMRMLGRLLGEHVELAILPQPGLGAVRADRGQIEQIILNLAVNARDAMPDGGKLTIETRNVDLDEIYASTHVEAKPGPHVLLAVTDTGMGMPAHVQTRIFEPFFTTKERGRGTGLGLATVYGIVKQSGGNIWVYSEPGHGTTFKLYFPRVLEAVPVDTGPPPTPSTLQGTETVLVVEDEESVRSLACRALRSYGYHVIEAANGGEAILLVEQHEGTIHLLVTDVVLPRMNGRRLADRLTAARPGLRVLYMSGYTENAVADHGALDPGTAFLQKPFPPDTLVRRVREVLDQPA